MSGLQQRANGVGESDYIGIEPFQRRYLALGVANHLYHIHRADSLGVGIHSVEILYHLLLVRDSHIQPRKTRIAGYYRRKQVDFRNLKINIFRAYFLGFELLVEKSARERMSERITD